MIRKSLLAISLFLLAIVIVIVFRFITQHERTQSQVTVLTYSSFVNSWGPGPELKALFKQKTGRDVIFVEAEDGGILLQKLRLLPADVVLGIDQLTLYDAEKFEWRLLQWRDFLTRKL